MAPLSRISPPAGVDETKIEPGGSAKGSSRYFASELPGYYDEYDEYVYEWARSRFVRDVMNLTGWRCAMERWEDGDRLACAE